MSGGIPTPDDDRIADVDAYLDGRLQDQQRSRLESETATRPQLADALRAGHEVDASLRRLFDPNSPEIRRASFGQAPSVVNRRIPSWRRRAALLAVAAVLALAATFMLDRARSAWFAAPANTPVPQLTPLAVYRGLVNEGFKPSWTCADDREFIEYTQTTYGEAFRMVANADVAVLGWTYRRPLLSSGTGVMLARANGAPVTIFVDRLKADHHLCVDAESGMHLFRRELGSVVLYELSGGDTPAVLPLAERVTQ